MPLLLTPGAVVALAHILCTPVMGHFCDLRACYRTTYVFKQHSDCVVPNFFGSFFLWK